MHYLWLMSRNSLRANEYFVPLLINMHQKKNVGLELKSLKVCHWLCFYANLLERIQN